MIARLLPEAEFLAAQPRWDALLAASSADSFFLRHAWLSTWWKHFKEGRELRVFEVLDGGATLGFAPLCLSRTTEHGVLPAREVSFLGREKVTGDYLDFVALPGRETEVAIAVLRALLEHPEHWDLLRVTDVLHSSPTLRILRNVIGAFGLEDQAVPGQVCPYRALPATWEEFLRECSPNLRSNLRRRTRRLEEMGAVFAERGAGGLDSLFTLHEARWKAKGRHGNFADPRVRAFHRDLAPRLDAERTLALWTVEIGGRTVAAICGFRHRGTLLYYQAGFDPAFAEHGVGLALMGHAIRRSIERGLVSFDFLRGDEEYKRRWTPRSRCTESMVILKPGVRSWAWKTLGGTRAAARRWLDERSRTLRSNGRDASIPE